MPSLTQLLALPTSILLLISTTLPTASATASDERRWPYNLPAGVKYWPEEEAVVRKSLEVQEKLLKATGAVGMRKMSGDEGEKFFLEYWAFEDDDGAHGQAFDGQDIAPRIWRRAMDVSGDETLANVTAKSGLLPPFLLHDESPLELQKRPWSLPRSLFAKRDFQCPSNTRNCSSIDRPNSCCAMDETCVIVQDTGLGDVGCCPSGSGNNCGGEVSDCDTDAGYTSCPDSDNGGCCIPNYKCDGIGCKFILESNRCHS